MRVLLALALATVLAPASVAQTNGEAKADEAKPSADPTYNLGLFTDDKGAQALTYSLAAGGRVLSGYTFDDRKVSLDLDNATLRDALKQLFERAKADYALDGDAGDARITLRCRDVRLTTALDMITQTAGVHWAIEAKDGKVLYCVGKSVKPSPFTYWSSAPVVRANGKIQNSRGTTPLNSVPYVNRLFQHDPTALTISPDWATNGNFTNVLTAYGSEERHTFTCPHCKGQSTIIVHKQQAKCPKCGRSYAGDWQYCPVDGTKRPGSSTSGDWRFCPLCGKSVGSHDEHSDK